MGMDGTAIAAAGKRVLALGLLLGALIVVALLLGTGSAQAHEKGLGDTLGVHVHSGRQHAAHQHAGHHAGHHAASARHHAHKKATVGRTAAAHPASNTPRHAVRTTLRQVTGPQPVRRSLAPLTQSLSQSTAPGAEPVRDTVKAAANTVRSTQPVKRVQDATLLLAQTVGDVRRTAQQLTGHVLPTLPPPGLPGVPVPPATGPDSDHPAVGSPQATDAFDSAATTARSGDAAPAVVQPTGAGSAHSDTASPGLIAMIGTAVSALRDLPSLPTPALPGPPHQDSGASSSVALFAGMLGAALLLALMSGLARLRSRRFRLVPNPTYRPSSSPD